MAGVSNVSAVPLACPKIFLPLFGYFLAGLSLWLVGSRFQSSSSWPARCYSRFRFARAHRAWLRSVIVTRPLPARTLFNFSGHVIRAALLISLMVSARTRRFSLDPSVGQTSQARRIGEVGYSPWRPKSLMQPGVDATLASSFSETFTPLALRSGRNRGSRRSNERLEILFTGRPPQWQILQSLCRTDPCAYVARHA